MSVITDQKPRNGEVNSKPGQLVIQNHCLQISALPLDTGKIPAFCTKRSMGASVHSRTTGTLRQLVSAIHKTHPPVAEIYEDSNLRKAEPQLVVGVA